MFSFSGRVEKTKKVAENERVYFRFQSNPEEGGKERHEVQITTGGKE